MIPLSDLALIGLRAAPSRRGLEYVPTSGAAQPFRDFGELFPRWLMGHRHELVVGFAGVGHGPEFDQTMVRLHATDPKIEVYLSEVCEFDSVLGLRDGSLDVVLGAPDLKAGDHYRPLGGAPLLVLMSEMHPLAQFTSLTAQQVREQPVFFAAEGAPAVTPTAIRRALIGEGALRCSTVGAERLREVLESGLGVTLVGEAPPTMPAGLCVRPLADPSIRLDYGAFWRAGNRSAGLQAFLDVLPASEGDRRGW